MNLKKYQAKRSAFTLAVGDVSLSGQTWLGEAEAVGSQFTFRQLLLRWWRSFGLTGARRLAVLPRLRLEVCLRSKIVSVADHIWDVLALGHLDRGNEVRGGPEGALLALLHPAADGPPR